VFATEIGNEVTVLRTGGKMSKEATKPAKFQDGQRDHELLYGGWCWTGRQTSVSKQRRPVILMVRETPLILGHLTLMTAATEMGAVILPPMVALYHRPSSITDIIDHGITKALDLLGLNVDEIQRGSVRARPAGAAPFTHPAPAKRQRS
jgi:hypothetical protein